MPQSYFGFQIDFIVVFGSPAVFFLLTVLAHHNERRLNSRNAGKHQINQYTRVRIERSTACKFCDSVCGFLPQSIFFLAFGAYRNLAVCKQIKHFFIAHILTNIVQHVFLQLSVFFHVYFFMLFHFIIIRINAISR